MQLEFISFVILTHSVNPMPLPPQQPDTERLAYLLASAAAPPLIPLDGPDGWPAGLPGIKREGERERQKEQERKREREEERERESEREREYRSDPRSRDPFNP